MIYIKPIVTFFLVTSLLSGCAVNKSTSVKVNEFLSVRVPERLTKNPYYDTSTDVSEVVKKEYSLAVSELQKKRWNSAEKLFKKINIRRPDLSGPLMNLGVIYRNKNDFDLAQKYFQAAIEVNNSNVYALNELAMINRERGSFIAAERHYINALKIWPHFLEVHKNLGVLYDLYLKQPDKAVAHYKVYLKYSEKPSKTVKGWVIDLERRLKEA